MTNKLFFKIYLVILPFLMFSQESRQTITFSTKNNLFAPAYLVEINTNEVNTIRADVQTEHGNLSIMLIDYNKNGMFNDYRGCCKEFGGSDGVILLDYKASKSKIMYPDRFYIIKKHPIVINGFTYRLSNLHQNIKGVYIATLTKRIVASKEIFKPKNVLLIDKIPKDSLTYLYSKKKIKIRKLLSKKHKTLVVVSDMRGYIFNFQFNFSYKRKLSKYFENIEVIKILVVEENEYRTYKSAFNKFNKMKEEFLVIPYYENQKVMNFGFNKHETNYFLVNEKGVITFTDLQEFMFINKMKEKHIRGK